MVSYLGKGLNITIVCDHVSGHNWMSYLSWYSINRNLPDAKVSIVCKRNNVSGNLFLWTKKLNIPFRMCGSSFLENILGSQPTPNLLVTPYCMAVRDFDESGFDLDAIKDSDSISIEGTKLLCEASSDDFYTFCSYEKGWGRFITKDWIHKQECPLSSFVLKSFSKAKMSLNEKRIEDLWNSSLRLFQTVSGGIIL